MTDILTSTVGFVQRQESSIVAKALEAADLRQPEIALPDDRQVQSAQAAGPHHRAAVHTGTAPQVMASLRNTVLNMHRLTGADNIAQACRVTAFRADRGLDLLTDHRISRSQAC